MLASLDGSVLMSEVHGANAPSARGCVEPRPKRASFSVVPVQVSTIFQEEGKVASLGL